MDRDNHKCATFFISTGRCATQWFADRLATHYSDLAVVKHEPFHMEYEPRFYFRAYNKSEKVAFSPDIENHLNYISNTLNDSHYVETGWPVYGVLPFIFSRLNTKLKVVHLYRHPIRVAASVLTHNVYSLGEWTKSLSISPTDFGVSQDYLSGERWEAMTEFEKCLFWWTEINNWALKLQKDFSEIPWLSLKYENVFSKNGRGELRKLLRFLSLPEREDFLGSRSQKIDKFVARTDESIDVDIVKKYARTVEVMKLLEYDHDSNIMKNINSRYKRSILRRFAKKVKGIYSRS